ncbi:MAG: choice-of-anchor D domain-containing protein, partial [Phycisphaerales bacterium]|nr:choice-of-anchor D domain-containing protein [Phycisphaerales bacterium]
MRLWILLLPLTACVPDYVLSDGKKDPDPLPTGDAPVILVTPTDVDFGSVRLDASEAAADEVRIENIGADVLILDDIWTDDDETPFAWSIASSVLLSPGDSVMMPVGFFPLRPDLATGELYIASNDPDTPVVTVSLAGLGVGPAIQITPETYDYGLVGVGCYEEELFTIGNVGNEDLTVTGLEMLDETGTFALLDATEALGELPWVIAPGAYVELSTSYVPPDILSHDASFAVTSDDPLRPVAEAVRTGEGTPSDEVIDSYLQPDGGGPPDILFVLDNSGSMLEEQTALASSVRD